jgi:hypothetical protein
MVSINIHPIAHHGRTTSPLGSVIASKLRTVLSAALPVVVMGLVLVGLIAFRLWASFPVIRDVAAG